jgi:6-methylsalicylate decarboxylase
MADSDTPKPYLIDVHHHFYPPEFSKAVADFQGGMQPPLVRDWTVARAVEECDQSGIATAVLSLWSIPGVWMGADPAGMRRWARMCNDFAARMRADHPGRFGVFAALPMPDVDGSLAEIAYAFDTLKADGVEMMTNFGDKWPGDAAYRPVYEELNRRKAVVYYHPVACAACTNMLDGLNDAALEVPYDTGRCVMSLILGGFVRDFPDIKWVFSHGGGTIPLLSGRIKTLTGFSPRVKEVAPGGLDPEFQRLYYETANAAYGAAMAALLDYIPASQIMFGTDYPYVRGLANANGLKSVKMPAATRKGIEAGNALRILPHLATPLRKRARAKAPA